MYQIYIIISSDLTLMGLGFKWCTRISGEVSSNVHFGIWNLDLIGLCSSFCCNLHRPGVVAELLLFVK